MLTCAPLCSVPECSRVAIARGWCDKHWQRWRKHGDPTYASPRLTFEDRVKRGGDDECWPWTGAKRGTSTHQYGVVSIKGRGVGAHVVAWMRVNGPLPTIEGADFRGTVIRHTCDNSLCCNPKHLVPGTQTQNMQDAVQRRRTNRFKKFCVNGHPRTPDNLYRSKDGLQACRTCHRESERERRSIGIKQERRVSFSS